MFIRAGLCTVLKVGSFDNEKIPCTSAARHLMPIVYRVSLLCAMSATKPLSPSSSMGFKQIGAVGFGRALEANLSLPPL